MRRNMLVMFRVVIPLSVATAVAMLVSCGSGGTEEKPPVDKQAVVAQVADWEDATSVRSIVFFGQKEACPCTRKRVDGSWDELSAVIGDSTTVELKRLQLDVNADEYDRFDDMRAVMVPPGIYFLDGEGKLLEMLQGEVDQVQVVTALMK